MPFSQVMQENIRAIREIIICYFLEKDYHFFSCINYVRKHIEKEMYIYSTSFKLLLIVHHYHHL